jgi:hypothetical protein
MNASVLFSQSCCDVQGITEELLKIFPPVPDPEFIPSTNATIGFSTAARSNWSHLYFLGSQAARNDTIIDVRISKLSVSVSKSANIIERLSPMCRHQ